MMKRVSFSHLKSAFIGRSGNRNSENAKDANGDLPGNYPPNEVLSEDDENSSLSPHQVKEMCTPNKSKRNILKTLRWKWRKKRGSLGLHDLAETTPSDSFGGESPPRGTLRGFVPKKLRSKILKSATKRTVCPISNPVQCSCEQDESTHDLSAEPDSPLTDVPSFTLSAESDRDGVSVNCVKRCSDSCSLPCDSSISSVQENPRTANLTRELFKLSRCGWYWGPVTRSEAEEKLLDQPDGAFLVRDSSDDRHLLSISFRSFGRTLHTRIEHCNGMFSFYAHPEPEGHASIVELIEQSIRYSQSGVFCYSRGRTPGSPSYPVRLTKPMSRFNQVRTLQYLCRFVIRQYTRFDHIQKLPLPGPIKGYLEEGHY